MKKALSIILALALCAALAVPALADDAGGYEEIYMNGFMSNAPWWGMFGVEFEAVRMEWGSITFYSEENGVYTVDDCSILVVKPGSKVTVDGSYGAGVEDAPETFRAIVNVYKLRPDGSYEAFPDGVTISSGVIEDWPLGKAVTDSGEIAALLELPGGFSPSRYVRIGEAPAEAPAAPAAPFTDVPEGSYYFDAVNWAYNTGVTKGATDTTFDPAGSCTRGQVVTFLWRAAGEPEPVSSENPFTDVKESDYFFKAVLWAVEQGVTNGTGNGEFSPKQTCSSAHIITFLYRALGIGENGWGEESRNWAIGEGLTAETGLTISKDEDCPRSAVVTFLYRAYADK